MTERDFEAIIFLLIFGYLIWRFILSPILSFFKKPPKPHEIETKTDEEMKHIINIKLFNVSTINQEYKVIAMIESHDKKKEQAKRKLQLEALKVGGNAVINVTTSIDNNVTGSVGSVAGMPRVTTGSTSTETTYHYDGTAILI